MNSRRPSKTSGMISKHVPAGTLPDRWQAGMSGWDEKGIVLIAIIALIAILALVGTVGVVTTTTEVKISSNYKTGTKALYAAKQAN
ncbi:MAG: hypothetical protein JYX80_03215 [Candidatus Scalindua sediminis]|nr:hypothetical protein [Candidatus Scalindua sediminis]